MYFAGRQTYIHWIAHTPPRKYICQWNTPTQRFKKIQLDRIGEGPLLAPLLLAPVNFLAGCLSCFLPSLLPPWSLLPHTLCLPCHSQTASISCKVFHIRSATCILLFVAVASLYLFFAFFESGLLAGLLVLFDGFVAACLLSFLASLLVGLLFLACLLAWFDSAKKCQETPASESFSPLKILLVQNHLWLWQGMRA